MRKSRAWLTTCVVVGHAFIFYPKGDNQMLKVLMLKRSLDAKRAELADLELSLIHI